jgi:non-specific serine/threonine protein kinase
MMALLGLLALRQGMPIRREELAEALWPEQAPEWQKSRLRNELSLLTQMLGDDAIIRDGRSALALADHIACDVTEFAAAVRDAENATEAGFRLSRLCAAVHLQTADFMPGFYEERILTAREQLRRELYHALRTLITDLQAQGRRNDAARWHRILTVRFPDEEIPLLHQSEDRPPPGSPLPCPSIPPNRFYGRNAERAAIQEWRQSRRTPLLTITGPAGIGKTRLACETLPDAAFVSLTDLSDGRLLYETIRNAWRLEDAPGRSARDTVLNWLQTQETLLLLDNFEQIIDTGAPVVADMIAAAPGTRCVITSRARLQIAGEGELHLAPLTDEEGYALFVERAREVRRDFPETDAVADICGLLEGIPLALELAASRALTLSPAQMYAQLRNRFQFLVSQRRDFPDRHRSLRAALEWSVNLLPSEIRRVFPWLSVFRGGFTLAAVEAVLSNESPPTGHPSAADVVETLRSHSLLLVDCAGETPRYDLLMTMREYGMETLLPDDSPGVRERHARFYADMLVSEKASSPTYLSVCDREWENLRTALDWLAENAPATHAHAVTLLFPYWESRGMLDEGAERSGQAAALCDDPARAATLLVNRTRFLFYISDFAAAEQAAREALDCAGQAGDSTIEARAKRYLGEVLLYQGDTKNAAVFLLEARDLFHTIDDRPGECGALLTLGMVYSAITEYKVGRAYFNECRALARQLGDRFTALMSTFYLGDSYNAEEDYTASAPCFAEVIAEAGQNGELMPLAYARWGEGVRLIGVGYPAEGEALLRLVARTCAAIHHRWGMSLAWEALSYAACEQGDNGRAVRLMAAAERLRCELRFPLPLSYRPRHERYRNHLREFTDEQFATLWQEGDALSYMEASTLALQA